MPDLSGVFRTKRMPVGSLGGALRGEAFFPGAIYAFDCTGTDIERALLPPGIGDDDWPLALDPGTLRPVPWRPNAAQVIGGLVAPDGTPCFADPRAALGRVAARFEELRLAPVAALELEFQLLAPDLDPQGRPRPAGSERLGPHAPEIEVFAAERFEDHEAFFQAAEDYASAQGIELKGELAEYAPGQFEINLGHGADMLRAGDEALMLKRLVKAAARGTGRRATFMPKPFIDQSGNGLHVHLSLMDQKGRNLFGETQAGEQSLRSAVAGLQALLPEAMLLLAPGANSYRRLRPFSLAPTSAGWGVNNRSSAIRVPLGPTSARRLELRVAGADANPYLVLALMLAGVHHGLSHGLEPTLPEAGSAYANPGPALPLGWGEAITAFSAATILPGYLGAPFCALFRAARLSERRRFEEKITPTEYAWYLGA